VKRTVLLLILMLFTRSTEPMDMMKYDMQPFREEDWRCTKVDLDENTCVDLHILQKPRIIRRKFK